MRLGLLDGFELSHNGSHVRLPLSAQRLVAFLALQERPLQRLYVAGTLWIDSSEAHANASLRTALWRLHRPGWTLVDASPTHLRLHPSIEVDLRSAVDVARRALRRDDEPRRGDLDDLCLAGDLLPDWYDDWVLIERERFRQLRLHALEALCCAYAEAGSFATAVEAGLAAVEAEPLRESAHRCLIGAYLAEGNALEAIRQYRLFRRLLHRELGLEPSRLMEELVNRLPIGDDGVTHRR